MKRRLRKALPLLAALVVYSLTWAFSGQLRITRPMMNLRYFYYGSSPRSVSDTVLYWVYYPPYRIHLALEDYKDEGRDFVHWSDRRD